MRPLSVRAVAPPIGCLQMNSEILRCRLTIFPWSSPQGGRLLVHGIRQPSGLPFRLRFVLKEFRRPSAVQSPTPEPGRILLRGKQHEKDFTTSR